MARTKGSKNKKPQESPTTLSLTIEERLELLAGLIVDTLEARQKDAVTVAQEFNNA